MFPSESCPHTPTPNPALCQPSHRSNGSHPTRPERFSDPVGVNVATSGDTVLVQPGSYSGPGNRGILFHNKIIVLRSEGGSGSTVIETAGEEFCSYNLWDQTHDGVVEGFTIHSVGDPEGHSAIQVDADATPTIRTCLHGERGGRGRRHLLLRLVTHHRGMLLSEQYCVWVRRRSLLCPICGPGLPTVHFLR
jgi:hypothetical protein